MFAKVFAQIFDSSISEDHMVRHVFMDLLVLADKDGVVDMTAESIARRTNVPLDHINHAIVRLMTPDPSSRSEEAEGRRLRKLDDHRDWGWYIVNFAKYRNISDDEARKAYFREYTRNRRQKLKQTQDCIEHVNTAKDRIEPSLKITQAEAEAEAEVNNTPSPSTPVSRFPSEDSETVKAIYDAYPRHEAPRKAKRAIAKALRRLHPAREAAWLLAQTRAYAEQRRGKDAQFTPHPATWFDQDRYDDEATQSKPRLQLYRPEGAA